MAGYVAEAASVSLRVQVKVLNVQFQPEPVMAVAVAAVVRVAVSVSGAVVAAALTFLAVMVQIRPLIPPGTRGRELALTVISASWMMVVGSLKLSPLSACPPPVTATLLVACAGAVGLTSAVTVIGRIASGGCQYVAS